MSKQKEIDPAKEESISHWGLHKGTKEDVVISIPECSISQKVMLRVAQRAHQGMKTYGVTMERKDISTIGWIDHAIEEALDLAVYLTRLKEDLAK